MKTLPLAILLVAAVARAEEPRSYDTVEMADVLAAPFMPSLSPQVKSRYRDREVRGGYDVFLDPQGKVVKVEVLQSIPIADGDVIGELKRAAYKAPGRYVHFAASITLHPSTASIDNAAYREGPPPAGLGKEQLHLGASDRTLPEDVKLRYAGQHPTGAYRLYLDLDGRVAHVDVVRSIPDVDRMLVTRFEQTHYTRPPDRVRFVHEVELSFPSAPPGAVAPPRYRNVPLPELEAQKLSGEPPHPTLATRTRAADGSSAGQYMIYVDADGHVPRVDVVVSIPGADAEIVRALKAWKYKPQATPSRSLWRFAFGRTGAPTAPTPPPPTH